MKTQVIPLDFVGGNGPILTPKDPELFELVKAFCKENLAEMPDFSKYNKFWVSARINSDGTIERITGVSAYNVRLDIPIFRSLEAAAAKSLIDRMHAHFSDQGARGAETFIYISDSEPEESRCSQWREWMAAEKLVPAERYKVTIR